MGYQSLSQWCTKTWPYLNYIRSPL